MLHGSHRQGRNYAGSINFLFKDNPPIKDCGADCANDHLLDKVAGKFINQSCTRASSFLLAYALVGS